MAAIMPRRSNPADAILFNLTLALVIVGVVAVYDASYARALDVGNHDGFFFLKRQAIYAGLGILCMLAAARTGYWKLRRWSGPLLVAGLITLIAVWLPGIGIAKNGAHRWIGHEPISLQPSEFAKLALIIYLAALLSRSAHNIRHFADGLIVPVCVIGLFVFLIEREPD